MGWKETYASKLTSMDEAAKVVKSGDTVIIAHAVGEPVALIDKMVDYAVAADLHDIKIHQMVAMGHGKYGRARHGKTFRCKSCLSWWKHQRRGKQRTW